jgi:hypothetical protein
VLGPIGWIIVALLPQARAEPVPKDDVYYRKIERARELAKRMQSPK